MWEIIIAAIVAGALFVGGYFTGRDKTTVNNYDVHNVQQTAVQTRTQTDVFQGQCTVVVSDSGKTLRNVNVNLNSATNITVEILSNGNRFTVTNGVTNQN